MNKLKNIDPAQIRSAGNIVKFLVVLLAFTLIARGTSGATLARVALANPDRREIIDAISAPATVSATDTIQVNAPAGLAIDQIMVNTGQTVDIGMAIATFDLPLTEELYIRETATLDRMRLDLERLNRGETLDTTPVENAQRTLNRAREDYQAAVAQGEADIAEAQENLDALMAEADIPTIRNHQRAFEDYQTTLAQGQADIDAAQYALRNMTVDTTALDNAQRNRDRAQEDYDTATADVAANIANVQAPTQQERNNIENAQRTLQRARDDYNTTVEQGRNAVADADMALHQAWLNLQHALPEQVAAAMQAVEQAQTALQNAQAAAENNRTQAARRVEDAEVSLRQAQQAVNDRTGNALEGAENQGETTLLNARRRLEDAELNLAQAQQSFDNAYAAETERLENALENTINRAADNAQAARRRLEDATGTLNTEVERAQGALQTAITRANDSRQQNARRVEDAAASLASAQATQQRNTQQAADTSAQNTITAATLALDIAAQEETLAHIADIIANQGVFHAPYTGTVATTFSGDTTTIAPLITLRDTAGGFEATMEIPRASGERLAVGSQAEVTTTGGSMFFTPTVTGIVSAISTPNDNDRVTITITLPEGDWTTGQRVDAQAIMSRGNYDLSVPISALNSDNSGYFLLVMEQRSTIMGLQNVVERVNVTIHAQDDDNVSVIGSVSRNSQVIVSSNKPVHVGDRVRVE